MDRYTKIVLTIIAAALCAIVARNEIPTAAAIGGRTCGSFGSPCYIEISSGLGSVPVSGRVSVDIDGTVPVSGSVTVDGYVFTD